MKKFLRILSASVLGLSLMTGVAAAQMGTIDTTGPDSSNEIVFENDTNTTVDNITAVSADVTADQDAETGEAKVNYNTTGGDAETGDAENMSEVEAELAIDNSGSSAAALEAGAGCGCDGDASIENTGPNSTNEVTFNNTSNVEVVNDTAVDFTSDTTQAATSGDATVRYNTTGGNATTGGASNSSSTVFSLNVTN